MSVLTITPNPSNVGDTVAVATVADQVVSDYNLTDLSPFTYTAGTPTLVVVSPTELTFSGGDPILSTSEVALSEKLPVIDTVNWNWESTVTLNGATGADSSAGLSIYFYDDIDTLVGYVFLRVAYNTGKVEVRVNGGSYLGGGAVYNSLINSDIKLVATNSVAGLSLTITQDGSPRFSTLISEDFSLAETVALRPTGYKGAVYTVKDLVLTLGLESSWSLIQDAVQITSGTTTGGVISYDHTAQASDNNTDWKYIVNGIDSNIVTMLVESGSYYTALTPYSCTLKLAMEIRKGYANTNSIFDWGSTADTYTTDATYISEGYTIWDRPTANIPEANLNVNGFTPFGTHFSGNVAGYRYPLYQGKANFHGDYHSWAVELIPDSSAGYTYDTATWTARNVTGFSIGSLTNYPFPICTPDAEYSISYNRIGKIVREYDSGEASEHRVFSMQWSNLCGEDLRALLVQIITVIRGNSFTISAGSSLARLGSWLPREGESLSGVFDVRLASPEINYTCTGADLWDLEIKVMKWES